MTTTATVTDHPLALHQVTKSFGGFCLHGLDLDVPSGQVTGLVGANGAGKTTAIKCALGMMRPDSGTTHLIEKERVGVVLDNAPYAPTWRVADVERGLAPFYPQWDADRFARLITWGGMTRSTKVRELSRGMSMRLQLAVALSHDARLLVLDEPTSGIDPIGRSELLDELADFMQDEEHAVLFSTHITGDLDRIADRIVILADGRLVVAGQTDEVRESYRMVRGGSDLPAEVRALIHGLRVTAVGWSGLMATEDTVHLNPRDVVEPPSLDDLVIHLSAPKVADHA